MPNNPTKTPEWKALTAHKQSLETRHMREMFESDPARFRKFSMELDGLFFDYSKHRITDETLPLLCDLARACGVEGKRQDMLSGKKINRTEDRAALHTALRRPAGDTLELDGQNILPAIHKTLSRMKDFSDSVRGGTYKGHTGKPFKHVVNIGIGGSDLGPHLVCDALEPFCEKGLSLHFVFDIDGAQIARTFKRIDPETTLFLVASKSFSTQETMTNAAAAKDWLIQRMGDPEAVQKHFAALSSNTGAAKDFGIPEDRVFGFEDWVGGRYSLWSAIGLPVCIGAGFGNFQKLLEGARAMDRHFETAPFEKNMPVIMALIGIWYRNFWNFGSHAILPYAHGLKRFPAYLQQLDMESNGKSVDGNGQKITGYKTGPVVFGESGPKGQHAFYQLLHQGTDIIPCDFIAAGRSEYNMQKHQDLLLGNMLAQGQALMQGRKDEAAPHRNFEGNRPSSTLLLERLDPRRLGMLIALYEHKIFVQGAIWNINSFDQFGVELGKQLAKDIEKEGADLDSSTRGLLERLR
ncbi:MAG: glucose-6-phosphate isomerase [Rhodospirillales bacterium]|nr:glucose-6-phosphate isomerase [Alphaproteobacteria bacterium]USO04338.1 MAG: glucose-6-phosphate isomerase [Rhodospirillales bacterium]